MIKHARNLVVDNTKSHKNFPSISTRILEKAHPKVSVAKSNAHSLGEWHMTPMVFLSYSW